MKTRVALLLLLVVTLAAPGCRSLQIDGGFVGATNTPATTAPAPAQAATGTPVLSARTTPAATKGTTKTPTPTGSTPATPPASSPAETPMPPIRVVDTDAAVQTLLDYFDAINERDYERAYKTWGKAGTASGQTLEQFTQGYSNTVRVTAQLGEPEGRSDATTPSATIPITLAAVVNDPASQPLGQRVQRFRGTYTLQAGAPASPGVTSWQIASAAINEVSGSTGPAADVAEPVAVLQSYFAAINSRQYARAYTYWDNLGKASQQTFAEFHRGFATTSHVSVDLGTGQRQGAAGSLYEGIPVVIVATQIDGTTKSFCGNYALRRPNMPPFDQLGWSIFNANVVSIANVQPGSDEAKRLLNGGCAQQ